mgnify:CR=1 FL=1
MQTDPAESQSRTTELVSPNVIRVETALSRYPVHRLAKQGTTAIEIREQSPDGELSVQWRVSHSSEYGQPGPLAYKLDTLIVNRRIEEASRPIPKLIKLGSLKDICRELGIAENGKNTSDIKKSLYQNAFAGITAKLRYRAANGSGQTLEAGFNRYAVVFTGEELSDGRKADAVYLELSDRFIHVLNGAQTRPLDYDYLRDLPPASQRLYELLSYQMYATLKYGRRQAKLSYAEFCTHAPLRRAFEREKVRSQMKRVHSPHLKSGYIQSVELEQTTDRDGKPDWLMLYTPGSKARAEYRAFTKRGGPKMLEIEQPPALEPAPRQVVEPSPLERELVARGVLESTAAELAAKHPERVAAQVEHFDWLKANRPQAITESDGGFLAAAVRKNFPTPKGFESKAEREVRERAEREKARREAEARRVKEASHRREQEAQARITAYLAKFTAEEQEQFDAEALEAADFEMRTSFEKAHPKARRLLQIGVRQTHVRRILGLPSEG